MKEEKPKVTLASIGQARVGTVFIHKGAGSKCQNCKYFQVCVGNLEPERVYKIAKVRQKTLPCRSYETEMQVVEVIHAEVPAAVLAKQAIAGAVISLQMPDCDQERCDNLELCFPTGLMQGDRCEIVGVTGNLRCSLGFPRKKVLLRRLPPS